MNRSIIYGTLIVLSCSCLARAVIPTAIETSTPRLGAMAFVKAMEINDMEAFRAVTIGGEEEYKLFQPLVEMVGAAKKLEKAARDKFGKAGRIVVRNSPAVGLEVQIQESDVKVNGDTAIVSHKGQEDADPLTLKKTSAGWKVDLTAIKNRQSMSAAAPSMRKMQQVLTESATDIRAGKFKTPEEAEQAVLERMQKAATEPQAKGK